MKLTKQQKNIGIILLVVVGSIFFNQIGLLNITGTFGNNDLKLINDNVNDVEYEITVTSFDRGEQIGNDIISSLGFGETTSSNIVVRTGDTLEGKRDVVSRQYPISSATISGVRAVRNYQTANEEFIGTPPIITDVKGYCKIYRAYPTMVNDLNCSPTATGRPRTACNTDLESTMGTAQSTQCIIDSAKLVTPGYETEPLAYAMNSSSQIKVKVMALKQGVQCTPDQLVNCNENQECVNNQCVQIVIQTTQPSPTPIAYPEPTQIPTQPTPSPTTPTPTQPTISQQPPDTQFNFYIFLIIFIGIIGGLGYFAWRMFKKKR